MTIKDQNWAITSHGFFFFILLYLAVFLIIGCSPSTEGRQNTQPEAPKDAQTSAPSPLITDPAAAARLDRVRSGIEQGVDVNKADPEGRTVLMMAAFDGYDDVVELLLEHGAKVDSSDSFGRTALMYAASGPFPKTVKLLIQSGADVNRADTAERWTALMLAAAEGHQPVVELLLQHGAKIDTTDDDGDAAIDHAREREQKHIVDLLHSYEGR